MFVLDMFALLIDCCGQVEQILRGEVVFCFRGHMSGLGLSVFRNELI